jgi:hypothetical protein
MKKSLSFSRMLQESFFCHSERSEESDTQCHPERSEGSHGFLRFAQDRLRRLRLLRMTEWKL